MRAERVLPAGTWDSAREVDHVLLDHDDRHRRRIVLHGAHGTKVQLDLPHAVHLHDGDGLALPDGAIVRVRAKPEKLLEIFARESSDLMRIAWHLGNRHLPVQMLSDCLRIRADHVIEEMVEGLGGHVKSLEAPFDPETGAYVGTHHHHDH
jgi:urease accessory protein